ncbi:hypothetical protein YC2023_054347 [Brassica napus]
MSHHRGSPIQPGSIGSVTYCSSTTVNESHWREIELSNHEGIHSQFKFLVFAGPKHVQYFTKNDSMAYIVKVYTCFIVHMYNISQKLLCTLVHLYTE